MNDFKEFSVLSWNIRGAANAGVKRHFRGLLAWFRPILVFIMETHTQFGTVQKYWEGLGYKPVHIVEARGHAGGIWCLTQTHTACRFSVVDYFYQAITVEVEGMSGRWVYSGIYASPIPTARVAWWENLQ